MYFMIFNHMIGAELVLSMPFHIYIIPDMVSWIFQSPTLTLGTTNEGQGHSYPPRPSIWF